MMLPSFCMLRNNDCHNVCKVLENASQNYYLLNITCKVFIEVMIHITALFVMKLYDFVSSYQRSRGKYHLSLEVLGIVFLKCWYPPTNKS
jgi:hypothetical protein